MLMNVDLIYPIGSIYMTRGTMTPGTLFGGRWIQIKDRFIVGCGDSYANGAVGGEASVALSTAQMPRHSHAGIYWASYPGSGGSPMTGNGGSGGQALSVNWNKGDSSSPIYTGYVGSGQAHNNIPPYYALYIWERVE